MSAGLYGEGDREKPDKWYFKYSCTTISYVQAYTTTLFIIGFVFPSKGLLAQKRGVSSFAYFCLHRGERVALSLLFGMIHFEKDTYKHGDIFFHLQPKIGR